MLLTFTQDEAFDGVKAVAAIAAYLAVRVQAAAPIAAHQAVHSQASVPAVAQSAVRAQAADRTAAHSAVRPQAVAPIAAHMAIRPQVVRYRILFPHMPCDAHTHTAIFARTQHARARRVSVFSQTTRPPPRRWKRADKPAPRISCRTHWLHERYGLAHTVVHRRPQQASFASQKAQLRARTWACTFAKQELSRKRHHMAFSVPGWVPGSYVGNSPSPSRSPICSFTRVLPQFLFQSSCSLRAADHRQAWQQLI